MKNKPLGMRIGESVFCIGYLLFVSAAACVFLKRGNALGSLMTLLLGGGDAFHLIPRILGNIRGEKDNDAFWLGLGNLVSSITMTVFYVILYLVMDRKYALSESIYYVLLVLCAIRILLCLMPQNNWFAHAGNPKWGIIRNVPFVIMGIITVAYLFGCGETLMAVLVTVSFICYMLVVLLAHKKPMMGMMMIPKTICYIWMIARLLSGK